MTFFVITDCSSINCLFSAMQESRNRSSSSWSSPFFCFLLFFFLADFLFEKSNPMGSTYKSCYLSMHTLNSYSNFETIREQGRSIRLNYCLKKLKSMGLEMELSSWLVFEFSNSVCWIYFCRSSSSNSLSESILALKALNLLSIRFNLRA